MKRETVPLAGDAVLRNAALEAGGVLVSDEVRIACEVQLVKQG